MGLNSILQDKEIPQEHVEEHIDALKKHLGRSFENVEITPVPDEEVTARGPIGGNAGERGDEYSLFFRVRVNPSDSDEPLESDIDYGGQIRDELESAERNSRNVRDTQLHLTDHDPRSLVHRNLYFYVYTVF